MSVHTGLSLTDSLASAWIFQGVDRFTGPSGMASWLEDSNVALTCPLIYLAPFLISL